MCRELLTDVLRRGQYSSLHPNETDVDILMNTVTHLNTETLDALQPAVRRMAFAMSRNLPASVEVDVLVQAGMIGLHQAMSRYVASEAGLEAFAFCRVRGAMLDELRVLDWAPRSCRRLQRRIDAVSARLAHQYFRSPTDAELAGDLGISIEQLRASVHESEVSRFVHIEDLEVNDDPCQPDRIPDRTAVDPVELIEVREQREAIRSGLDRLSSRKRAVIRMYYFEDMSLKDIGTLLGVSESRVCQLHREALANLRAAWSCQA